MTRIIPLLFIASLLTACGGEEGSAPVVDPSPQLSDIQGSSWQLQEITVLGGFTFTPEQSSDYTLHFESDNRLRGQSDCNTISGEWSVAESLQVSNFSSTRSLCVPGSLHNYYTLYLRNVNNMEWQGESLVLRTPDEGVGLRFARSQ